MSIVAKPAQTFSDEALLDTELWDREFSSGHTIPSSTRTSPSHALQALERDIPLTGLRAVLDAGCGNGRHAVYFAGLGSQVVGVDSSAEACAMARALAEASGLSEKVTIRQLDLGDALPRIDGGFDLVLDAYVSCHIAVSRNLEAYLSRLLAVTAPGGCVVSLQFSMRDSFYASHAVGSIEGPAGRDPVSGIVKRLWDPEALSELGNRVGHVPLMRRVEFEDVVHGSTWNRSILALIIKRQKKARKR